MIDVRIVSNTDERSVFFDFNILDIVDFAYEAPEKYPFLSSIDYYWVTYFSFQQVNDRLLPELLNLSRYRNFKEKVNSLIRYIWQLKQHDSLQVIWD